MYLVFLLLTLSELLSVFIVHPLQMARAGHAALSRTHGHRFPLGRAGWVCGVERSQ